MEAAARPYTQTVEAYYDETWLDYTLLWLSPRDAAIHFGFWDEETRSHGDSLLNANAVLARELGLQQTEGRLRILDAGCGVGGSAIWLANEFDVEVVGITPVESQVKRARVLARRHAVEARVSFAREDFTRMSFADASFDVVWALESVCHAHDKAAFMDEAYRVLRPGGRLGMFEYLRHDRPYNERDESLIHSWLSGWAIPDLATSKEILEAARVAGFEDVSLQDVTRNVRRSLRRLHRMTMALYPFASLLRALGLRSRVQHGNMRGARDQFRSLRRNLWFYGRLLARKPEFGGVRR